MSADLLSVALAAARAAGDLLLARADEVVGGISSKTSGTDLVSDADRDAEALVIATIRAARPGDGILAEEGGGGAGSTGITWVVDPLDGTINYLWGVPQWSVSIAAADDRGAVAGVVHDPSRGETFTAVRGGGARMGGRVLAVTPGRPLGEALVGTGFSYRSAERAVQAGRLTRVLPAVRDVRRLGSAALDLCWVAAGRLDGYYETGLNPWDRAAGELVAREAGARVRELAPGGLIVAGPDLIDPLARLVLGDDA
ncbi:inositol monophosphatase family protein [Miltoncostaea oceani]|uniref:inositol monophosphatase family protein n=1 Tax=Miltoncostaea oceani TaxID=2843216 RepID=UPI001C3D8A29|nr:inositol monophosphatase family protein [Miltoncostaea oceani]